MACYSVLIIISANEQKHIVIINSVCCINKYTHLLTYSLKVHENKMSEDLHQPIKQYCSHPRLQQCMSSEPLTVSVIAGQLLFRHHGFPNLSRICPLKYRKWVGPLLNWCQCTTWSSVGGGDSWTTCRCVCG